MHRNLLRFALRTLGVDEQATFEGDHRARLVKLMTANGLTSFIYSNVCKPNSDGPSHSLPRRLMGVMVNGSLQLSELAQSDAGKITGIGFLNRASHFITVRNSEGNWVIHDKAIDKFHAVCPSSGMFEGDKLTNETYKQIYDELIEAGYKMNPPKGYEDPNKEFARIANAAQKQVNEAFYADVKLRVDIRQLDENGEEKNLFIAINSENVKDYELRLIYELKGNEISNIIHETTEEYLKPYEDKWIKEVKLRGYDANEYNISVYRQEVRNDFSAVETVKAFAKRFIDDVKGLLNEKLPGHIEAIQATRKVAGHIWAEGKVNESLWSKTEREAEVKNEGRTFPEYMHSDPVLSGGVDGVIDEIAGIPMAIRAIHDVATDEKKREALTGIFTKEGVSQLIDGLKEEAKEIANDQDKAEHFAGQTTVAVTVMFTGFSALGKSGKVAEILDKATTDLKRFVNPKVVKVYEDIRNYFIKRPKDGGLEVNEYISKLEDEALNDFGEQLAEETDEFARLKSQPIQFINGRKYEKIIQTLIDNKDPQYINDIFTKADIDITLEEFEEYIPLSQVQIRIPGKNGGFTTMDNVWVKEVTDATTGKKYLEAIVNECKLSKNSPFSLRQDDFKDALDLDNPYFELRNVKFEKLKEPILQNTEIRILAYLKTTGTGKLENKFKVTKIK